MTNGPAGGSRTRTVFLGSGGFGLPSLRGLARHPDIDLVGVVTAPPRASGRGQTLQVTPVQVVAEELAIPAIVAPDRLRDPAGIGAVLALEPDLLVLADYGQIVPAALLETRHGALNLHPSLLPRHRGATPIPAAILAGDATTGVTVIRMDDGLDTGPIVAQATPARSRATRRRRCSRAILASQAAASAGPDGRAMAPWRDRGPAPARSGSDIDPAAAARGRPARPGSSRRRARAPGPGLPAVAGLVRRHAVRTPRGLVGGRRMATDPAAGTFDELGLGVGTGERLRLDRGPAGRWPADAVGRLPARPTVDRGQRHRAGPVTACASIAA